MLTAICIIRLTENEKAEYFLNVELTFINEYEGF